MTAFTLTSSSERTERPVQTAPRAAKGIGQIVRIGIPLTVLAVFATVTAAFAFGGTPLGEAIGYGAYLAFWIGGGFGLIASGAYYSHVTHDERS